MANKVPLHLTIDADLLDYAKKMKGETINSLSEEFEEWLKIRINQDIKTDETFDYDKEYTRIQMELKKLESKKEMKNNQEMKDKEKLAVIDLTIDNEIKYTKPEEIANKRFVGLKYLFNQKFNEKLTDIQAIELLNNRLKERGLIA